MGDRNSDCYDHRQDFLAEIDTSLAGIDASLAEIYTSLGGDLYFTWWGSKHHWRGKLQHFMMSSSPSVFLAMMVIQW